MFNKRVEKVRNLEASSVGAAIIGCIGLGLYADFDDAIERMVSVEKSFEPDAGAAGRYATRYAAFLALLGQKAGR